MKKIFAFLKTHKYAIIWTACYIAAMWAVLRGLFNFNIFCPENWVRLAHAQLRGFGGMVFGILILAALPLYVATTTLIVRTGKPLFTIPAPKILTAAFKQVAAEEKSDAAAPAPAEPEPAPDVFPENLPSELRNAFIRARQHIQLPQQSTFNATKSDIPQSATAPIGNAPATAPTQPAQPAPIAPVVSPAPVAPANPMPAPAQNAELGITDLNPTGQMPIPTDFDIDGFGGAPASAPSFSDVDFSGTAPTFHDILDDTPTPSAAPAATPTATDAVDAGTSRVVDMLKSAGRNATIENDIIISGDMAIAVHDDSDFWIADADNWFAPGKQRPSPVAAVKNTAAARGLRPVLYLAATNIMDIDKRVAEWESDGIKIARTPDEII